MFISQGFKPHNKFWKYILGFVTVTLISFIGYIPFIAGIVIKVITDNLPRPTTTNDYMTLLDPNLTLFLLMLSFVFEMLGLIWVVRFFHKQTILEVTTSRKKVDWKRIFFSFSIWAVFSVSAMAIDYFSNPADYVINFKPLPFAILFAIAIVMIPIQTSLEEYLFRGYLMQGFAVLAKNKWLPLLTTSVIFGLMHLANPEVEKMGSITMVYYIGTGLFLGIITLMDDGMELALGFHAANNLVGALLVTSDWSAFQTDSILKDVSEPSAGFDILFPVLVIFPIMLVIFSKKYNWTGWKEKLTGKIDVALTQELK